MQGRWIRAAALIAGLAVAAGCGKYSISNIRSLKAFQDANNLYKKREYSAAAVRYQDAVRFNPDLGFAYFFLGNSYDNLYKPNKKGAPENEANLHKAVENYRIAIDKMANVTEPKEKEIPQVRLRVPDRRLRHGQAERLRQGRAGRQGAHRPRAERGLQLPSAWPSL